ncbi:PREDICTED: something about silencing protein 10 [Polistes dominula]|uniref:Something about silencing protein 10 n=1 Tax=Polistes dominula TaxID=743375 RepID=A0ABM1I413_POLDO|nr:PREDICTED: something about silencing protein 10 [Polistes dominula]
MAGKKRGRNAFKVEAVGDEDMNDISDSDDQYSEEDRELLKSVRIKRAPENFDSDDEVFGLQDDEENEEEDEMENEEADSMESDIEELEDDFDIPNEKAWGKKKKTYYSTDYVDPDYSTLSHKNQVIAEMEEQEAISIQKKLAERLDDADFGLDFIEAKSEDTKAQQDEEETVKTDFTKLSKKQKRELVQRESPEFLAIVDDFKECMNEAKNILLPFLKLVEKGICPDCPASNFVKSKYQIILNYCVNISFYLMLKAKRLPINSHPVIKRLAQYRQLLNEMRSGEGDLLEKIEEVLKIEKDGGSLYNISGESITCKKKKVIAEVKDKKAKKRKISETNEEEESDNIMDEESDDDIMDDELNEENNLSENDDEDKLSVEEDNQENKVLEEMEDTEEKRAITYQIAKNKGLTPHRKKEQRNPRVKHRNKYRKAKIRRKGAVREVRKELTRYSGEMSGINVSAKKSIKLK